MRGMHWLVGTLGAGSVVLLAACSGGAGGGRVSSRDSAGVSIVESTGPAWPADGGWKVVDSPLVSIADVDRVLGPVRLNDGRLAIANGGTSEVRIYDATGAALKSTGRAGSGPGEYQNLAGIWVGPADSLMVSDVLVRRLTVLDREGNVGRSFSLGSSGGGFTSIGGSVDFAVPQGWLADGSIIGLAQTFSMKSLSEAREGAYRDTLTMVRYAPDGTVRDTIGRFPGPEMEKVTMSFMGRTMSAPMPVPLGKQFVATARDDRFYVALNNAWEIEVHGLDGSLKRLIRTAVTPIAITPNDVAANRKTLRDQLESQPMMRSVPEPMKKQLTDRIDLAKYPASFAFFAGLLADGQGNLWAQEAASGADNVQRFAVIDSAGRFLGRVAMPVGFRPSAFGSEAVFGVWKDADDVEYVRAYPLRKDTPN